MKTNPKNSKAVAFLKKNVYYIIMVACIIAIATMVTLAVVLNQPVAPPQGGDVLDKPSITEPDPSVPGGNPGTDPDENVDNPEVMTFVMPMENAQVIRRYSATDAIWNPTLKEFHTHQAIDYTSENPAVKAVYDGVVESIAVDPLNGSVVIILHKDNIRSIYGSVDKVSVKVGTQIKKGTVFAEASTSMGSEKLDGAHLHFQMSVKGELTDPATFLPEGGK